MKSIQVVMGVRVVRLETGVSSHADHAANVARWSRADRIIRDYDTSAQWQVRSAKRYADIRSMDMGIRESDYDWESGL